VPSKATEWLLTIEELQHASALNAGFKMEGLGLILQQIPGGKRTTTRVG